MTKIINLSDAQQERQRRQGRPDAGCEHKHVTVYRLQRTVCCSLCGELLDPFEVLVEMVQGYVPALPEAKESEAERLVRETDRRQDEKQKDKAPKE